MTAPNVHIRSVPDDPRRTTIAVDGREVIGVVAARWEAEVRGWPTVTLEIDIPTLDVRGSLVGVSAPWRSSPRSRLLTRSWRSPRPTSATSAWTTAGPPTSPTKEAALWERIEP